MKCKFPEFSVYCMLNMHDHLSTEETRSKKTFVITVVLYFALLNFLTFVCFCEKNMEHQIRHLSLQGWGEVLYTE